MSVNEALRLIKGKNGPAISIYLGTDRTEKDSPGMIRNNLHRLYRSAEDLLSRVYDPRTRERLLTPLRLALSLLYLRPAKGGVAIYHNASFTGVVRLSTPVTDLAIASDSFHVKPLLRSLQLRQCYFILAFKRSTAELISVSVDGVASLAHFDIKHEAEILPAVGERPRRQIKNAIKLRKQKRIRESIVTIRDQLESYCQGERGPLILAGPDHLQSIFREESSRQNLLETGITQHVDDMDVASIALLGDSVVEEHFASLDRDALPTFKRAQLAGLACNDIHKIAEAAALGQIQSLLIAEDRHVWGHLDRETGQINVLVRKEDEPADDLLDDIAELTLHNGGKVTVLPAHQIPGGHVIAAVLRWASSTSPEDASNNNKNFHGFQAVEQHERRYSL
jgi:hypothetical protein